jgi:putative transposase
LPASIDATLAKLLDAKANALGCSSIATGVASDHVHVIVRLETTVTLAGLVGQLKGASAHHINERVLLSEPLRWQVGYWAESVSPSGLVYLERYVRTQRSHHDDAHPAEAWQRSDL